MKNHFFDQFRLEKDPTKTFDVKIDAIWTTNLPHYNFDTDMHPKSVANAMAMVRI